MSATRKDKDYTLVMKTYLDGGICCKAEDGDGEDACGWSEWGACSEEENDCFCEYEILGQAHKRNVNVTLQNATGQEYLDTALQQTVAELGEYPFCSVNPDGVVNVSFDTACVNCSHTLFGWRRDEVYSGTKTIARISCSVLKCKPSSTPSSPGSFSGRR